MAKYVNYHYLISCLTKNDCNLHFTYIIRAGGTSGGGGPWWYVPPNFCPDIRGNINNLAGHRQYIIRAFLDLPTSLNIFKHTLLMYWTFWVKETIKVGM